MRRSQQKNSKIAQVARCIFPNGKAVLMGYDRDGKEVFGIGVNPKSVVKWVMQGVQKGDLARLLNAYVEWLQADSDETATP